MAIKSEPNKQKTGLLRDSLTNSNWTEFDESLARRRSTRSTVFALGLGYSKPIARLPIRTLRFFRTFSARVF